MDMSRRTILKAGVGLMAAAAASGGQAAAQQQRLKFAVKYNMINEGDTPLDKLQLLRDIGYAGVEPGVRDEVDREELKAASEETGIEIHGVVNGSSENIGAAIDLAKFYGASSVLVVAGRVSDEMPYAKNYEHTQQQIRDAVPQAKDQEIMLLVENVWNNFLLSPLEMKRYLDELDSEWVGAYFDVGNVARFGWPAHWIPVLSDHIKKLDIKAYDTKKQMEQGPWKGFDVEIGEGDINWEAVSRELDAIDYSGWATAEVGGGGRDRLADILARMQRVLQLQ